MPYKCKGLFNDLNIIGTSCFYLSVLNSKSLQYEFVRDILSFLIIHKTTVLLSMSEVSNISNLIQRHNST